MSGSGKSTYEYATNESSNGVALKTARPPMAGRLEAMEHERAFSTDHHSRTGIAMKRAVDVVASLALLIVLSPLWLFIALLIKIDSPGPILFRQIRIGRDGEPFAMLKFRTMIKDADLHKLQLMHLNETQGLFKISADPRITRTGRLLRSTSFDELPQLLHVVTGRMTLVGPRPLVPEEDAKIPMDFRVREQMRPGMTGSWQVAGASEIPLREMMVLDRDYVAHWTIHGDLKILLMTVPHVVFRRGI